MSNTIQANLVAHIAGDKYHRSLRWSHTFTAGECDGRISDDFIEIIRNGSDGKETTFTIPLDKSIASGDLDLQVRTIDAWKRKRNEDAPALALPEAKRAKRTESGEEGCDKGDVTVPDTKISVDASMDEHAQRDQIRYKTVDAESPVITRLNETPEGRLELLDNYWRLSISDFNRMGMVENLQKADLIFNRRYATGHRDKREGDEVATQSFPNPPTGEGGKIGEDPNYKIYLDFNTIRATWTQSSIPLPTKDDLCKALASRHFHCRLYGSPYLGTTSNGDAYEIWIWHFIKHQLIRFTEAYCGPIGCGFTQFVIDEMHLAVLGSWDAVAEFEKRRRGDDSYLRY